MIKGAARDKPDFDSAAAHPELLGAVIFALIAITDMAATPVPGKDLRVEIATFWMAVVVLAVMAVGVIRRRRVKRA